MGGPLEGIRIVEFTSHISGPYAGLLLSDMGADVIKVEPPTGDAMRRHQPMFQGVSATFYALNRGKRSVVLDLRDPEGLASAHRLVGTADIMLENWRAGVADRLGLGQVTLRSDYPALIIAGIRGYSETGAYAGDRALDTTIQAVAGMALRGADGEPSLIPNILADKTTGLFAANALLASLVRRARTGEGEYVGINMLDAVLCFQWPDVLRRHTFPALEAVPTDGPPPASRSGFLACGSDGRWFVAVTVGDDQWVALCNEIEELSPGTSLATSSHREGVELTEALRGCFDNVTRDEAVSRLRRLGMPVAPVNEPSELLDDPRVASSDAIRRVKREGFGTVLEARFDPFSHSKVVGRGAPKLGEHTVEIVRTLDASPTN
jgi:crotonobetainyl-CoA:carnitine CoA-transferase CaiB-like acyl-CoA transferase